MDPRIHQALDLIQAKEFSKARELLEPLAMHDDPDALGLLGHFYFAGDGVERDGPKAVRLYTRAMELGNGTAAHNLATLYTVGAPGVDKDWKLAKDLYRKAKSLGAQYAPDEFYE
jgi:TPR repeat protein